MSQTPFVLLPSEQTAITKERTNRSNEIRHIDMPHCAIGYVLHGERRIHDQDNHQTAGPGDLFLLGMGRHHVEDLAGPNGPYEQILIQISSEEMQRMLLLLNLAYEIGSAHAHQCETCFGKNHAAMPAWPRVELFFHHLNEWLEARAENPVLESLKKTELLYLITSNGDCCMKSKLLQHLDGARDAFRQIIFANIFVDPPIKELARQCNRSLTSFKKEFFDVFKLSPHQWFMRQRLIHARMLLISSNQAISQIGTECGYPNTSHFIKLFRKQYEMTPAVYRARHRAQTPPPPSTTEKEGKEK